VTSTSYIVTATPPTPNGDLHVGHLSGPYIAADVFTRFQRMRGNCAIFLSSTDDHQSFVVTSAERLGEEPALMAARFGDAIAETLIAADCDVQFFSRALNDAGHRAYVQQFVLELCEHEVLVPRRGKIQYCEACREYLVEAFARGRCPSCGELANANLCEACGRVFDTSALRDARCCRCDTRAVLKEYEGLFLPLERHRAALERYFSTRTTWRPHLLTLCDSLISEPLIEYPASYPARWGIPVPLDAYPGQVVNVWLEMYPGQIHTTRLWAAASGNPGQATELWEGTARLVQFLGHDNSFFNAVLHPAIAMAGPQATLVPDDVITNQFYLLAGEKFSTSRHHLVLGREALADAGPDVLRFYIALTAPEHWQTSFSWKDLHYTREVDLAEILSCAVDSLLTLVADCSGSDRRTPDLHVIALVRWAADRLQRFYDIEEFSLRDAAGTLLTFAAAAGEFAARDGKSDATSAFYLSRALAVLSAPLMPRFAKELWQALGLPPESCALAWGASTDQSITGRGQTEMRSSAWFRARSDVRQAPHD
jgi:methionyl-tRNA synthetase